MPFNDYLYFLISLRSVLEFKTVAISFYHLVNLLDLRVHKYSGTQSYYFPLQIMILLPQLDSNEYLLTIAYFIACLFD